MTIRELPVYSARCSSCGVLYADEETSDYLFDTRETMWHRMFVDGWQPVPPLCPPCQPEGSRG